MPPDLLSLAPARLLFGQPTTADLFSFHPLDWVEEVKNRLPQIKKLDGIPILRDD